MINIVTALQCEAKPLIQHYKLKGENTASGFRLYENEEIRLIVSGLGKMSSAAACAYLYARHGEIQDEAWLNLGIAGHATLAVGTPVVIQKITDEGSGLSWYPPLVFDAPCSTALCLSVDKPADSYADEACIDMEAAGFYATASRFATSELIHCFKIISDNQNNPATQITEKKVLALVEHQLPLIDQLIQQLEALSSELKIQQMSHPALPHFLNRWHFTRYQKNQLQQLLQRWQALQPKQAPQLADFAAHKKSKEVLHSLQQQLDAMPINFDSPKSESR